jgi:hypothetical protein
LPRLPAAEPEPTATPIVPSDTPKPTDTPEPTDTPTPPPTATPDITATAAVLATESAAGVLAELEKSLGDSGIPYQNGHLIWQQTEPITIQLSGPDNDIAEIDDNPTGGNFVLRTEVTWEATGWLICGMIFRSEPDIEIGKQYRFLFLRLSGLPAWAIEVYDFGDFKNSATGTKFSSALDLSNGATNTLLLAAQNEEFTLYINGQRMGRYYDFGKQLIQGSFGFVAGQDSGTGSCKYENTWIWSLD